MLPTGLQMLPLLWLLLWTPKLGLSSPQSLGDMMSGLALEGTPTMYNRACDGVDEKPEGTNEDSTKAEPEQETEFFSTIARSVPMVGSNNDIYKQFKKSRHSAYMAFNVAEIRAAVPESASLLRAELHLHSVNQRATQTVNVFEKYGKNSWRFVRNGLSPLSNKPEWMFLDITGTVCQWLSNRGEIEVLRLTPRNLIHHSDSVLHMEISGIPQCNVEASEADGVNIYRPLLRILSTPGAPPEHVDCTRQH